jgi:long-chain acyl-CoA synthetase
VDVGTAGPAEEGRDVTEPAALVCGERRFSLPQLDAMANGLAAALTKLGATAGERVAVMSSNRPEFVAVMLAIWRLGASAVLVSPAWKRDEVDHALALTNPARAVGDHPVLAGLMPMLYLDEPITPAAPPAGPAPPAGDALLVFSSGTTGLPKAVRHTHASLDAAVGHWRDALQLTNRDRIQVVTPPSHILGLLNIVTALRTGAWMRLHPRSKWPLRPSRWPSPRTPSWNPTISRRCGSSCGVRRRSAPASQRP